MRVTRGSRLLLRLQNLAFVALWLIVVGLLAWLSTRYSLQFDWTANGSNTLSPASRKVLDGLPGPVEITAFASRNSPLRTRITDLVGRYRRYKHDLRLDFVDPATAPERTRALGIDVDGELLIAYQGRSEHVKTRTEQAVTNALERVARSGKRWVAALTGHGERDLLGRANYDLGAFGKQLQRRGLTVRPLNLAANGDVPGNTSVLVIPGPQSDLLPGEVDAIQRWVQGGGNLLWLTDPGPHHGLDSLAAMLGVRFLPGTIVDPALGATGPGRATFVVATPGGYADHPVTHDFRQATLFPGTVALEAEPAHGWKARPLIRSSDRTWDETGPLTGTVRFDASRDRRGPLTIGLALTREHGAPDAGAGAAGRRQQRVAVIGDGDFLSNAYLGNGGNLDLGLSLINWLSRDDRLVAIPAKAAPDLAFTPSPAAPWIIGIGSLLVLPLLLLGAGLAIWLRRRAR